jgi:glycosyltransferase involved in cell wall biosynthesis
VDDGSTDDSRQVIEKWAGTQNNQADNSFTIKIIHQENGGPSMARNTGLLACKGEYIQFLDSDDVLDQEKLKIQIKAIKKHNKDFSVCNYKPFSESGEDNNPVVDFFSRSHSIEDFPLTYPMDTPAPVYRRGAIVAAGPWNTAIRSSEDFEYNFRLLSLGARGIWLDQVLVYVRKDQNQQRIQSNPLKKRYKFMYHSLAEMEMQAIEQGICTRKLLQNLGIRALIYYEHMRAENDGHLGKIFLSYAKSRVPFWKITLFLLQKRVWKSLWRTVYPGGPRALIKRIIAIQ